LTFVFLGIELINKKSVIHNMESTIDYRLLSTTETSTYLHPLTEENGRKLDGFFRSLTKGKIR
jgi:predicted ATPase